MENYGKVESPDGQIKIADFITGHFKDNCRATVAGLEDESFLIAIENLQNSGQSTQQTMKLSKESFAAVISTALMYMDIKMGSESAQEIISAIGTDTLEVEFSNNLKEKWKAYSNS